MVTHTGNDGNSFSTYEALRSIDHNVHNLHSQMRNGKTPEELREMIDHVSKIISDLEEKDRIRTKSLKVCCLTSVGIRRLANVATTLNTLYSFAQLGAAIPQALLANDDCDQPQALIIANTAQAAIAVFASLFMWGSSRISSKMEVQLQDQKNKVEEARRMRTFFEVYESFIKDSGTGTSSIDLTAQAKAESPERETQRLKECVQVLDKLPAEKFNRDIRSLWLKSMIGKLPKQCELRTKLLQQEQLNADIADQEARLEMLERKPSYSQTTSGSKLRSRLRKISHRMQPEPVASSRRSPKPAFDAANNDDDVDAPIISQTRSSQSHRRYMRSRDANTDRRPQSDRGAVGFADSSSSSYSEPFLDERHADTSSSKRRPSPIMEPGFSQSLSELKKQSLASAKALKAKLMKDLSLDTEKFDLSVLGIEMTESDEQGFSSFDSNEEDLSQMAPDNEKNV